jgi:hypothetical protein
MNSKRNREFQQLLCAPLYLETFIGVKFPDGTILEAKFSPKETLKHVVDLVSQVIFLIFIIFSIILVQARHFISISLLQFKK